MTPARHAAIEHLAAWRQRVALATAFTCGLTDAEVVDELGVPQADVERARSGGTVFSRTGHVTPNLLIARRAAGEISTEDLLGVLRAWPYTPSIYAPHRHGGAVRGTWFNVEAAHATGDLTAEEYESLLPLKPADRWARR